MKFSSFTSSAFLCSVKNLNIEWYYWFAFNRSNERTSISIGLTSGFVCSLFVNLLEYYYYYYYVDRIRTPGSITVCIKVIIILMFLTIFFSCLFLFWYGKCTQIYRVRITWCL